MADPEIILTHDGSHSLFSNKYGVNYHSKYGAISETLHVFIEPALCLKAQTLNKISILEVGFGTGLNAFMTYLEAAKRNISIDYVAYEAYPISIEVAKQLNFPNILNAKGAKATFEHMHESNWNESSTISSFFQLKKQLSKFEEINYENRFDLIYFDAFAPDAQPELWEETLMIQMYKALRPSGILVTYCAKGAVKRTMRQVGFKVERLPGPPGKREMTRATKFHI